MVSACSACWMAGAIIRYALETNAPLPPELVRRADAGETLLDEAG